MVSAVDPVQAAIDHWRKKSSDLALRSTDLAVPVMMKVFELVDNVLNPKADPILIECSFVGFSNQRNLSLQYDSKRHEPIRDLTYDLFDAFHLVLDRLYAKSQSSNSDYSISTQAPQPQPVPVVAAPPSHDMNGHGPPDSFQDIMKSLGLIGDALRPQANNNIIVDSDSNLNKLSVKGEPAWDGEGNQAARMANNRHRIAVQREARNMGTVAGLPPMDNRVAPVACTASIHPEETETTVLADLARLFGGQPPLQQESSAKRKRGRSSFGNGGVANKSPTEMSCVICDKYKTHSVEGYCKHLQLRHKTNATEAGVIFKCACGNESRSSGHFNSNKCPGASVIILREDENTVDGRKTTTVVNKDNKKIKQEVIEDEPMEESDNSDMRNVDEESPVKKSAKKVKLEVAEDDDGEMMDHVRSAMDGGAEVEEEEEEEVEVEAATAAAAAAAAATVAAAAEEEEEEEVEKKPVISRTPRKTANVSTTAMQCVECKDFETFQPGTYIGHLKKRHNKTPRQAGVSFKCACGQLSRSHSHFQYGKCRNVSMTIVLDGEEGEGEAENHDEDEIVVE